MRAWQLVPTLITFIGRIPGILTVSLGLVVELAGLIPSRKLFKGEALAHPHAGDSRGPSELLSLEHTGTTSMVLDPASHRTWWCDEQGRNTVQVHAKGPTKGEGVGRKAMGRLAKCTRSACVVCSSLAGCPG